MKQSDAPRGWQLHHHELLFVQANVGAPSIRLKFFHYPSYRQTVHLDQPPAHCKLKKKGNNMFFMFHHKVHTKEVVLLERIVTIFPIPSSVSLQETWGRISENPWLLQRKYMQSFSYWPVHSSAIRDVSQERWFATDDLSAWVQATSRCIIQTIKYPEQQEKRLGADQALRTGVGDCDEFTDLFITLARIRGIPCRRITGYHITLKNLNMEPHAWGEILSPTLGWIPIDLALHNIGKHTINYIIGKIEEFNPSLLDYQVKSKSASVHYRWERPLPSITPIYENNRA